MAVYTVVSRLFVDGVYMEGADTTTYTSRGLSTVVRERGSLPHPTPPSPAIR